MNTDPIKELMNIARSKAHIDKQSNWSSGSSTYLHELRSEIDEVEAELEDRRWNYLEDELGDVLWDYLNLLVNLEDEGRIHLPRVLTRAVKKYSERINAIDRGSSWAQVKAQQKTQLADELERCPELPRQ